MLKRITCVLLLLILCTMCTCQREEMCATINQRLQTLSEAIQQLCGSSVTAAPGQQQQCNCSYPVTWTSVRMTRIGSTNLRHAGTLAYIIPSVIPSSANEVLVLANIRCGNSSPGPHQYIKIYTQQETRHYEQYILMESWTQNAINTNSDNMWFPMPTNRRVYIEVPTAHGIDCLAKLEAIGYR